MPSIQHEALVELFRNRPCLAADLLTDAFALDLPDFRQARLEPGEFSDVIPTEYRADAVVVLTDTQPVLAIVVEVQLGRDPIKRWTWPVYLSSLRARLRCPALLLVVCGEAPTATWCAAPIELGHPGWVLTPLTLGPDRVPFVTDTDRASQAPELAVLSALAHRDHPDLDKLLDALPSALAAVDKDRATFYTDLVFAALPVAARKTLEAIMKTRPYEYQSDFVRRFVFQGRKEGRAEGLVEGRAEGRVEGRAEGRVEGRVEGRTEGRTEGRVFGKAEGEAASVLIILGARGINVPDDAYARITACTDLNQLETWVRRAATATTIDDLYD